MSGVPHAPAGGAVVVGYDGSSAAREAIAHAAARRGNRMLVIVYGYGSVPAEIGRLRTEHALEEQRRHGEEVLARLSEECGPALEGVRYETRLLAAPGPEALVEAAQAAAADEIVVATRGFGDARTWLGSVSHELLRIADRPVVVIPPRERSEAERRPLHLAEPGRHRHPGRQGSPS